jgi:hypothetical protein
LAANATQDARKILNIAVHPAIREELRHAALREGVNMPKMLHAILCRELGRPDLLKAAPDYAGVGGRA